MGRSRAAQRTPLPAPWHGIRLRRILASADPDQPGIPVTLPASWDDQAASGLAALRAPDRQADLRASASAWIDPVAAASSDPAIAAKLHGLLLSRRGAPSAGIWRPEQKLGLEQKPGFVFSLPAFFAPDSGFDHAAFGDAIDLAVATLTIAVPRADRLMIGMADLALLLARMGIDYDSEEGRRTAADLAAYLTARATAASSGRHQALTGILPAGPVETLLGIETTGIAAPITALGANLHDNSPHLARWAQAKLVARGLTAEQALAAVISADDPFGIPSPAAARAMHAAVAPRFHAAPERASVAMSCQPAKPRESLPARRNGYTQKALVGGHRLFIRTGEYADGRLGDLAISLPRENAAFRGLMDAFASAVSTGLQHGVPLDDFIEAFTFTRFGPSGAVEGDPSVPFATSLIDYVFRHLAANYACAAELAPAEPEPGEIQAKADPLPFLPMELPRNPPHAVPPPRRPVLKLVG